MGFSRHSRLYFLVRTLINKKADLNEQDYSGQTLLYKAVAQNDFETVRILIRHSANVNLAEGAGWTPLHVGLSSGLENSEIIRYLLQNNADVNANSGGISPLHLLCGKGTVKNCKLLLSKGSNFELEDSNGWRPIHSACFNGRIDIIMMLLDFGVRTDNFDKLKRFVHDKNIIAAFDAVNSKTWNTQTHSFFPKTVKSKIEHFVLLSNSELLSKIPKNFIFSICSRAIKLMQ
jgi:ankyrin repeat protein